MTVSRYINIMIANDDTREYARKVYGIHAAVLDVGVFFFFSSRRRHTRFDCDWSSDVCSSDLTGRPSSGGVVLTASGLTFVGGTDDFRFRAFATATGQKLWEIKLPSSVETTPKIGRASCRERV